MYHNNIYSPLCEKHNFQITPNANGQPMKLHTQRGNVTEFLFHISDDQLIITSTGIYIHIYFFFSFFSLPACLVTYCKERVCLDCEWE